MKIRIEKYNETYIRIYSDKSTEQDLSEFFKFPVPGARWMPKFKARVWDGYARLYNLNTKTLYAGLIGYVKEFAERYDCQIEMDPDITYNNGIKLEQVEGFAKLLKLHSKGNPIEIRDYQLEAVHKALNECRTLLISPTASGKSLIIYTLLRWFVANNMKCLIIVPTTLLVEQLYSDFADYSSENGWSTEANCQKLYAGLSKDFHSNVLITTWQSTFKLSNEWYNQWDAVFSDECLHPDTIISLDNGNKKISDVKLGDLVLTLNEETNCYEYKPILKIHKNLSISEKKYKVKFDDGSYIIITGNHKQFTKYGWKRTDKLIVGDLVKTNSYK